MSVMTEGKVKTDKGIIEYSRKNSLADTISYLAEKNVLGKDIYFLNGYCLTTKELSQKEHNKAELESLAHVDDTGIDLMDSIGIMNPALVIMKLKAQKNEKNAEFGPTQEEVLNVWVQIRMGLSLKILDQAVNYLNNRYIGETEQLKMQLIKSDIAQFITEYHSLLLDISKLKLTPLRLILLHERITQSNESLIKLCGGSGYIRDGVMDVYFNSRVIQQIYGVINV
ncbi:hypothetical protein [Rossellomorea aquimaris]|uniref:Uncharacterized protein n=1 Tax=Rossellomorea aquimaris TaxID=189382 RepID=A0A1J6WD72_9BACI|nr:hypothetical protein [Rossellomorea aquimaris]OIU69824.1 hypothetical protein BHE18_02635 [Rossellomorea aquimaris]